MKNDVDIEREYVEAENAVVEEIVEAMTDTEIPVPLDSPGQKVVTPPSSSAPDTYPPPDMHSSVVRSIVALAIATASLIFYFAASANPQWISSVYKPFSRTAMHLLGLFWAAFPWPVVESALYAVLIGVPTSIVLTSVNSARKKYAKLRFLRLGSHILLAAAVLLAVFCGLWGPNYRSAGMAYELGLEVRERSPETLAAALGEITDELNRAAMELPIDAEGNVVWGNFRQQATVAKIAWDELAASEPFFGGCKPLRTKPVILSRMMSYTGITGIFLPFTGEANVNSDFPDPGRIFTMTHETAHSMACAAENEANFAAYLACRGCSDPTARYSGYLAAFSYCYNALYSVDREAAFEFWYRLPPQAVKDYAERAEYWAQFEGKIQQAATSVNDAYLKAMNQPSGVKSYGEVVDLILADFVARTGYTER